MQDDLVASSRHIAAARATAAGTRDSKRFAVMRVSADPASDQDRAVRWQQVLAWFDERGSD